METEESTEQPMYGPHIEESSPLSGEKMALIEFAYRLGSGNFANEPGIAADESNTYQEAQLLMSLLASPLGQDEFKPISSSISSSDSEHSYPSDASSYSRRDTFRFSCPSLSLERSEKAPAFPHLDSSDRTPTMTARCVTDDTNKGLESNIPLPATLLRRPLKVDDRDALRLSADAMARNVRQSFQKAIDWRIQAWIHSCSKKLVEREKEMIKLGASQEEMKKNLLTTSEAILVVKLREVAENTKVMGAVTRFEVLAQRPLQDEEGSEPATKKQRLDQPHLEEGEYQYNVSHVLMLECVVNLQTPAGFSEVTLQVPGYIEGTFLSTESDAEELKSVVVEVNTDILAAMVEKSCRTIVRACVEHVVAAAANSETVKTPEKQEQAVTQTATPDMKTPTPSTLNNRSAVTAEDVRTAIVTPRALFSDTVTTPSSSQDCSFSGCPKPVLLPIPDNFDDEAKTSSSWSGPRRISPQPNFLPDFNGGRSLAYTTPDTPKPSSMTTTTTTITTSGGPPLISPPLNESSTEYKEVPENGPSLPMLVEVACRAMQAK